MGARDFNPGELARLSDWGVNVEPPAAVSDVDYRRLAQNPTHVHIDLDVLDPSAVGAAKDYAAPGGLSPAHVCRLIEGVADHTRLTSASLASYDPAADSAGHVAAAAHEILRILTRTLSKARSAQGIAPPSNPDSAP